MMLNIQELFAKHDDKFLEDSDEFDCRDLVAFNILKQYRGNDDKIICSAEHDVIYLNVDINLLAEGSTEDEIITLIRCGVIYDSYNECFSMYY